MSEYKPYEATPSRLQKAKREGDVARSHELSNVAAFLCGIAGLAGAVPQAGAAAGHAITSAAAAQSALPYVAELALWSAVPIASAACGACACTLAQSGGMRFVTPAFKLERLAPAENLRRMLSREAAITALRASIGFAVAAFAVVPALRELYAQVLRTGDTAAIATSAWNGALRAMLAACAIGAIFALADYGVQFAAWRKRLRMTADEVRRDQKEHDGDPLARSRRRAVHRAIARGSLRRIKDAAFIVANPTHVAIALEYRPPEVQVPRVLIRAADETALRVRELAGVYGVPVIENIPLARRLFSTSQPGDYIPHECYVAVAEIVAALR